MSRRFLALTTVVSLVLLEGCGGDPLPTVNPNPMPASAPTSAAPGVLKPPPGGPRSRPDPTTPNAL